MSSRAFTEHTSQPVLKFWRAIRSEQQLAAWRPTASPMTLWLSTRLLCD
jgi:hypothetical protein